MDGELSTKINELKSTYTARSEDIEKEIQLIEREITRFCEENKSEFINKRRKKMNFGTISYRISEKVKIISTDAAIKALELLNFGFCLEIKKSIKKDEIKKLDISTLTKIGASIVKEDKLSIDPDIVEIAATI
jgi:phage host-nuclease inhibitor protein Gam